MIKPILLIVPCLLLCFSFPFAAAAFDPMRLEYITEDFRPYNYEENGEFKGLSVELLQLIWKEMGLVPAKITSYPWVRGYKMLQIKSNTVLFTTARIREREDLFKWVGPITRERQRSVLIAKKSRGIRIRSIEDVKQYKIGTIREDYTEQLLLSMGIDREMAEPVVHMEANLRKIQLDRIDLIAYTEQSIYKIIESCGEEKGQFETVFLIQEVFPCYAFNRSVPDEWIGRFQTALDKVKQRPSYQQLLEDYRFSSPVQPADAVK